MSKIRGIDNRLQRLERRFAPSMWEESFVDEHGNRCVRFGRILADGSRGPCVEIPQEAESVQAWEKQVATWLAGKRGNGHDKNEQPPPANRGGKVKICH
jgi:hypothetical protein